MSNIPTDIARQLRNLIAIGTIAETDPASWTVRVDLDGRRTGWLRMPTEIGRNFRRWRPLRIGSQVVVACPSGNPANAVIISILHTAALPPPDDRPAIDLIRFDDGTTVRHDSATGHMDVYSPGDLNLRCGGELRLRAGGAMWLDAAHVHVHEGG